MPIPANVGPQPAEAEFAKKTDDELAALAVDGAAGTACVDALGRRAVRAEPALRALFDVLEAPVADDDRTAAITTILVNQERAALWILAAAILRAGRRPWPGWIRGKLEDLVWDSGCEGPPAHRARFLVATYEVIEGCSGPQGAQPIVATAGAGTTPMVLSWWQVLRPDQPFDIPESVAARLLAIAAQPDEWLVKEGPVEKGLVEKGPAEKGAGLSARGALHRDGYAAARLVATAGPDSVPPWAVRRLALVDLALHPADSPQWNAALSTVAKAEGIPDSLEADLLANALTVLPPDAQKRVREALPRR